MISAFCLSGCASYLSNSVFAGAALFGTPYMQSMMSGQAAIAVVVSSVQVISSAVSVWGTTPLALAISDTDSDGKAEEKSARIFFGISALYMIATLLAYRWLASLPVYTTTMGALEDKLKARAISDEVDERQPLLSAAPPGAVEGNQIFRVFQTNFIYNFSVGFVFTITLVCFLKPSASVILLTSVCRLFIQPSLSPLNRRIRISILYCLVLYTFWCSVLVTFWDGTCVLSHDS